MHSRFIGLYAFVSSKYKQLIFGGIWLIGLLLGAMLAASSPAITITLARAQLSTEPFLPSKLLVFVLPIIALHIFIRRLHYSFCYPFLFLYALLRGFAGACLSIAFGSGAWLLRGQLLFSADVCSFLIWWLLLSFCTNREVVLTKTALACVSVCCFVMVFDFIVISPLVSGLS